MWWRRIRAAGFVQPFGGRVAPGEIDAIEGDRENWREGLLAHGLSSRTRAVLRLIEAEVGDRPPHEVPMFGAEAVTALALRLRGRFARFLGSEYGMDAAARAAMFPIPHQDLTAMTLPTDSFDVVTTNEVLEHVPDLDAALREIARVLRPGGVHIGTHPFQFMQATGDLRTRLVNGRVVHLMEPEFHGNPVDEGGGSLVFETPGWDIVMRARMAGFREAEMRFVASERYGYLTENMGVFVFFARK